MRAKQYPIVKNPRVAFGLAVPCTIMLEFAIEMPTSMTKTRKDRYSRYFAILFLRMRTKIAVVKIPMAT